MIPRLSKSGKDPKELNSANASAWTNAAIDACSTREMPVKARWNESISAVEFSSSLPCRAANAVCGGPELLEEEELPEDDAEEANEVADLSEHAEELEQEKKASRFGDHYFAFFLTCTRHNLRLGSTGC